MKLQHFLTFLLLSAIYSCNEQRSNSVPENKIENSETTISLEKMPGGLYIYNIRNKDGAIIKAGKIIHL